MPVAFFIHISYRQHSWPILAISTVSVEEMQTKAGKTGKTGNESRWCFAGVSDDKMHPKSNAHPKTPVELNV